MDLHAFGQAIRELADEKGVEEKKVIETIELAVAAAYKKDYGKKGQVIRARFDPSSGHLAFAQVKTVVDETMIKSEEEVAAEETTRAAAASAAAAGRTRLARDPDEEVLPAAAGEGELAPHKVRFNPERHIMLEEAQALKADAQTDMELEFPLEPQAEFGRIASQTAKQVIIQRIREAEREATYSEYKDREGEIVSGVIQRVEGRNVFVDLGRGIAVLPPEEQIARERIAPGERIRALLLHVEKETRGPGIMLSRSHPRFVEKLFALEVPEIPGGLVEIRAVAREPGSRTKVAALSRDQAIDPVGSMVGQRGVRVTTVMNELAGEKIDIIEWAEDQAQFVSNALSPAKVLDVVLNAERREARAIVPDDQLSLAIGRGGQNVRLAAKLTGWKIDVRSAAAPAPPAEPVLPAGAEPAPEAVVNGAGTAPAEPANLPPTRRRKTSSQEAPEPTAES